LPLGESFLHRNFGNMLFTLASLLLATVVAGDCTADNCLRALKSTHITGGIESPQAFCAAFVVGSVIPPNIATACGDSQNGPLSFRISSACACIAAASAATSASSRSTFLQLTTTHSTTKTTPTTAPSSTTVPSNTTAACAIVSSSWAAQISASPAGLYPPRDMHTS
jgi:hypothetical protein